MTDQYVPALRHRFLEDMRIKGLLPKTQTPKRRSPTVLGTAEGL